MTWNDAATKVLRQEGKPLHYTELTKKILDQNLVQTKGKTPHYTVHASISIENKARREKGLQPRFNLEKGIVSLTDSQLSRQKDPIIRQAQTERDKIKDRVLAKLRQLSGEDFESYIEALLIKMGYQNVQLRGGPSDEGIDLLCEMSQGINQVKTGVQTKCKQGHRNVSPKDVRLLRDVLPKFKCSQGVLITTSGFTPQARSAANEEGRLPIILIDGPKTAELALQHEVGVTVETKIIKKYSIDEEFAFLQRKPQKSRGGKS